MQYTPQISIDNGRAMRLEEEKREDIEYRIHVHDNINIQKTPQISIDR